MECSSQPVKHIIRIENNEVAHLHPKTKAIIAKRLGVKSEEIETY
jgi:hypothetical protein